MAKFADMEEFPHVFQVSSHSIREGGNFEMKGRWNELFFKNDHPIVLELGCGKGEYTVNYPAGKIGKNHSLIIFVQDAASMKIVGANLWNF